MLRCFLDCICANSVRSFHEKSIRALTIAPNKCCLASDPSSSLCFSIWPVCPYVKSWMLVLNLISFEVYAFWKWVLVLIVLLILFSADFNVEIFD